MSTANFDRNSARKTEGSDVVPMELELASLRSVKAFAEQIKALKCNIDFLILNAAIMGCPLWCDASSAPSWDRRSDVLTSRMCLPVIHALTCQALAPESRMYAAA